MQITLLGGAGEIGGTKILLEDDDRALFLDFGLSFSRRGRYYHQYLTPRTSSGISDLLRTGIIPDIPGLYRDDPVGGVTGQEPHPATTVLLSHAHVDHSGHISLLRRDIEVAGSSVTRQILEASERSGQAGFESEVLNPSIREPGQYRYEKGVRPYRVLQPGTPAVIGGFSVTMYPVDHSVPGAVAFAVETSAGTIVYTGDFRLHGRRSNQSITFLNAIAGLDARAIIIEGTNVTGGTGHREQDVEERILDFLLSAAGRPVFCTHALRDLDRLRTFHRMCQQVGRDLVIGHKTALLLETIGSDDPDLPGIDEMFIYNPRKRWGIYDPREYERWERPYLDRFNAVRAGDVSAEPGRFCVYLDYYSLGELIDIDPDPGAIMIHSQAEPFSEEMELDFERLQNWLRLFDIQYCHAHASGHIYGDELATLVPSLAAETIIPVHTEHPDEFTKLSDRIRIASCGESIKL